MRDMKFIFLSLLLMYSVPFSQTSFLNINLDDGTTVSIPIEEITKITFDSLFTDIQNVKKFQNVIKTFTLFQNFPNPFNPTTTINYSIPNPGNVEIKIYTITGQLIKTIQKKHEYSGAYSIIWDGKNDHSELVSSGLYIYQASFKNNLISKKMIVIK